MVFLGLEIEGWKQYIPPRPKKHKTLSMVLEQKMFLQHCVLQFLAANHKPPYQNHSLSSPVQ
jgi:hypothetical protein